jgi:hypothetical protein
MPDEETKAPESEPIEVDEIDDSALSDVSGGGTFTQPGTGGDTNGNCPCSNESC